MSTNLATVVADFEVQLSTQLDPGGTTATLSSATDDDGVALPDGVYFFTIDGANSQKEHIVCSLSGTSLTNIKSVSRQGVETTGAARLHRVGATVVITDFAHLYFINKLIGGLAQLDSAHPLEYDGTATINAANQLTTVAYVLSVVNGGAVSFNEIILAGTAGETFSAGQPVYLKVSDSRWYKLLANDATLLNTTQILQYGIALGSGSAGVSISGGVATQGLVSGLSGLTANSSYYISDTGTLSVTPGTYSIPFGWATSTTTLVLLSKNANIPTPDQKAALAGAQGVPNSTNKFITQDNISSGATNQSQTTQNATQATGEADSTGKANLIAQSFLPTKTKIRGFKLYKSADTGTFIGSVVVTLQADSSGSPSGTPLATKTFINDEWNGIAVGEFEGLFSSQYESMTVGNLYWLVIDPSTSDTSNHPNLGTNSAGGYSDGSLKYKNTTDGWVALSTVDLYFKTLEGTSNQLAQLNSSGQIESHMYDLTKMPKRAFYQEIPSNSSTAALYKGCSNIDGSVVWILTNNSSSGMIRFERDSATGYYFKTHEISTTNYQYASIAILGDYLYYFTDGGSTVSCTRYDLATGANATSITMPSIDTSGSSYITGAWSDGTYLYMAQSKASTTYYKFSVSGTTFTTVTTGTTTATVIDASILFDGTNFYTLTWATGTSLTITKYTDSTLSSVSSSSVKQFDLFSASGDSGQLLVNIDSTRMYLGKFKTEYNATAADKQILVLVPASKI